MPARFLSLDDLAEELAVSRSQARALVRNGDIPAMRVERARLEAWITAAHEDVAARRTQHPPAEPTGGAAGVK